MPETEGWALVPALPRGEAGSAQEAAHRNVLNTLRACGIEENGSDKAEMEKRAKRAKELTGVEFSVMPCIY